jgi:hypothetical protein
MKSSVKALGAIAAFVGSALSKEVPVDADLAAELYDSGVRHEQIMMLKEVIEASCYFMACR